MAEAGDTPPRGGRRPRPRLAAPRKSLGQHFLISAGAAGNVARALGDVRGRTVVEIGPGRGILTDALLRAGVRVLAIELDPALVEYLRARFRDAPLEVVHGDVLSLDLSAIAHERGVEGPLLVAGNIPYSITSPLLRALLAHPTDLERAVLMVQREVADRLLAEPGTRAYGALTVGVRAAARVEPVLTLSPARFRPPPRVWSTVVRIEPRPDAPDPERLARLETFAKTLFAARRKQLATALRQAGLLRRADGSDASAAHARLEAAAGVPLTARPEAVPVEGFLRLLEAVGSGKAGPPEP